MEVVQIKKVLIIFLLVACAVVSIAMFLSKKDEADGERYYIQYIQDKLSFPLALNSIEVVNAIDLFADQVLDIKAYTSIDPTVSSAKLIDMGWNRSELPEEFERERLLETENPFDREILSYNEKYDCLWLYIDEYLAFYGKKADYATYGEYTYRSPNYIICLYEPESGQLFYKESDS